MALIQVQYFSEVLQKNTGMNVIMPQPRYGSYKAEDEEATVLYLLHGLSDDYTSWQRNTALERYAEEYNLAIIMPDAARSFYCDEKQGGRYLLHIAQELPFVVQMLLGISSPKERTYAGGISMGGYGALKLAFLYPDRFAGAVSFSGAVDIDQALSILNIPQDRQRIFGSLQDLRGSEYDLYAMARKEMQTLPRLYIACGTQDFFYGQHQAFCAFIQKMGYAVNRIDTEGARHEWRYWDAQLPHALSWMLGQ